MISPDQKTIYTTFDEVSRMMDFCCEGVGEEKTTSRNFYDWYLKEDTFFVPYGVFIMDGMFPEKSNQKLVCCFNFENPDCTKFELCNYLTQETLWVLFFYREQNLDMANITVDMQEYHYKAFQKLGYMLFISDVRSNTISAKLSDAKKDLKTKIKGVGGKEKKRDALKKVETIERRLNYIAACNVVRMIYATMYYSSKHQPELIEYEPNRIIEIEKQGIVNSTYKYTGYVNLNRPVYRPTIKKDPDEPARDYNRHIQKWTVRGHYRRTSKGLIWIEPHEKGEGELEKRIYGTEDESEVAVMPKVFEVTKNITATALNNEPVIKPLVSETLITPKGKILSTEHIEPKKQKTIIQKIKEFIFALFIK